MAARALHTGIKVDRRTVGEQVADALRERIIGGELAPGQRLNEAELATRLGVSRGPVREAFRQLVGEGLLVHQRNRGVSVWQPAQEELYELSALRAALEGMAVRLAVETGGRGELVAALAVIVEQMRAADRAGDVHQAIRLDGRFHAAIVERCGNRRIAQLWTRTHPAVWVYGLPALVPPLAQAATLSHRRLLRAIEQGTPAEVQESLIQHIQQGLAQAIAAGATAVDRNGGVSQAAT